MNIVHTSSHEAPATSVGPASIAGFVADARSAGFNVVPIKNKFCGGIKWKQWHDAAQTDTEVGAMFKSTTQGAGVITGFADLECLEFDDYGTYQAFRETAASMGYDFVAAVENGWSDRSPSGGVHYYYQCSTVSGNTKLAERPILDSKNKRDALIETRGQGGLVVCAPSHGEAHPTGKPYELLSGGPSTIARITPEQREQMFNLARTFDEMPVKEIAPATEPTTKVAQPSGDFIKNDSDGTLPGTAFDAVYNREVWKGRLQHDGWTYAFTQGEIDYYLRPGKKTIEEGISATVNHGGKMRLRVFTSGTSLEPAMYSPFAYFAHWYHGGNFSNAAKALYSEGYGDRHESSCRDDLSLVGTITPKVAPDADTADAQVQALIEENNALRGQLKAMEALMMNPEIKDSQRKVAFRAITIATNNRGNKAKCNEDGYVRMDAGEISNDYRRRPDKGGHKAERNDNGSKYFVPRNTVKSHIKELESKGMLEVMYDLEPRVHSGTNTKYDETIYLVKVTDPLAAIVDLAEYRSEKKRAVYGTQNKCWSCGEVHATTVRKTCGTEEDPGCGAVISERVIPVPPQSRPIETLDDEQVARLDERIAAVDDPATKNVAGSHDAPNTPHPNYMATKNVAGSSEGEADSLHSPDTGTIGSYCQYRTNGEECSEITEQCDTGYGSATLCHRHAREYGHRRGGNVTTISATYSGEVAS